MFQAKTSKKSSKSFLACPRTPPPLRGRKIIPVGEKEDGPEFD